jgi:MFS family permease
MAASTDRRGATLAVLCAMALMIVLDSTVVAVAIPTIQQDLGFSAAGVAWVVNAYLLGFAGLLLLAAVAAGHTGRSAGEPLAALRDGYSLAFLVAAGFVVGALVLTGLLLRHPPTAEDPAPHREPVLSTSH